MPHSDHDFDFSQLSAAERLRLAHELLDSVYDSVEPAALSDTQAAELQRRRDELISGKVQGLSLEQLRESLHRRT